MDAHFAAQSGDASTSPRLQGISHLLQRALEHSGHLDLRKADLCSDPGFAEVAVVPQCDDPPLALRKRSKARAQEDPVLSAFERKVAHRRLERRVVEKGLNRRHRRATRPDASRPAAFPMPAQLADDRRYRVRGEVAAALRPKAVYGLDQADRP